MAATDNAAARNVTDMGMAVDNIRSPRNDALPERRPEAFWFNY
jgi:hypothetical protein